MNTEAVMNELWQNYTSVTPQAGLIRQAFEDRGERVVNDHVAFRTLGLEPLRLERLERHILDLGYERYQPYEFPAKKLRAFGYVPRRAESPKIFLSELIVELLSPRAGGILGRCAAQVDPRQVDQIDVLWAGRLWQPIAWSEYECLREESEYAAWVASLGIRPNHFTISVNHLQESGELEAVLSIVEGLGCRINESGGRIKGSPAVLLEQASTMADRLPVEFAGNEWHDVATCYYEFARRYSQPNGELFPGFVAASADGIFESTNGDLPRPQGGSAGSSSS